MKKIFATAIILTSLMLFGCKTEEPKPPAGTETTTETMQSTTTTPATEQPAGTTQTEETNRTTTQPAPTDTQR